MQTLATAFALVTGAVVLLVCAPVIASLDDEVTVGTTVVGKANGLPHAASVVVAMFSGEGELSATVRSEHARVEAAWIVGAVPSVTDVRNELAVRSPSDDPGSRRHDR